MRQSSRRRQGKRYHFSISETTGDSAIVEYIGGKQIIHHSREYQVMTNSPTFDKQLALDEYWKGIGGTTVLPGTNRAADRFTRSRFISTRFPEVKTRRSPSQALQCHPQYLGSVWHRNAE